MKIYLIAPKNPESFWTFDRILPSLGKRCVFPNLALPTIGITGFVIHKRRMLEALIHDLRESEGEGPGSTFGAIGGVIASRAVPTFSTRTRKSACA